VNVFNPVVGEVLSEVTVGTRRRLESKHLSTGAQNSACRQRIRSDVSPHVKEYTLALACLNAESEATIVSVSEGLPASEHKVGR